MQNNARRASRARLFALLSILIVAVFVAAAGSSLAAPAEDYATTISYDTGSNTSQGQAQDQALELISAAGEAPSLQVQDVPDEDATVVILGDEPEPEPEVEVESYTLTFVLSVRGAAEDETAEYALVLASDLLEAGADYSYALDGEEQPERLVVSDERSLTLSMRNDQTVAIFGLEPGNYTIAEALPQQMVLRYGIGNTEAEAIGGMFDVSLDSNAVVYVTNARQHTVRDGITNTSVTVLHGDGFACKNANDAIVGAYVLDSSGEEVDGVLASKNGESLDTLTIGAVTQDCEIVPQRNAEDRYTFCVLVNGEWRDVRRPYVVDYTTNGERELFVDVYLRDMYAKFYRQEINSTEFPDYLFGHGGRTDSWNRRSVGGSTQFWATNNNSKRYLYYTPYITAGNGWLKQNKAEEIAFNLNDDARRSKESFYTVALSNELKARYGEDELGTDTIVGMDVAGGFALNTLDSEADFIGGSAITGPNVFGFSERALSVTVKVPNALLAKGLDGMPNGKVTESLKLRAVTNAEVAYEGSYTFDGSVATYTFDIPAGALTQPFEVTSEPVARGQVAYQYVDPANAEDDLAHVSGLARVNEVDQWQPGYTTRPSYSFVSYTADKKFTYAFDAWVDLDGTTYPVDAEILAEPDTYLQLRPDWKWTKSDRIVRVEYYNLLLDEEYPVDSENYHFAESPTYNVLGFVEDEFYQQTTGKRFAFDDWRTDAGATIAANQEMDLREFEFFSQGDYEVLKLTAAWLPARDPWNLEGQTWVVINDRFASGGYTTSERYLAMTEDPPMGKAVVDYDVDKRTCLAHETMPALWSFVPQDDGTYQIKSMTSNKYLNIAGDANVTIGDEPQNVEVLYNDSLKRYVFRRVAGNDSLLLTYERDKGLFGANKRSYAQAAENNDNGRKSRFLLATPKGSVVYTYPAYAGDYPEDVPEPSADLEPELPAPRVDQWSQGYAVKAPSQASYVVGDADCQWTYSFDHWEVVSSQGPITKEVGSTVTDEPLPPLVLRAVWKKPTWEPMPIAVTYKVERNKTADNNDHYPKAGTDLPGVDGLSMTKVGTDGNRYYTGKETATGNDVTAYAVKNLTEGSYLSIGGVKHGFLGWKLGGTDDAPDPNLLAVDGPAINLAELDTNGDKAIELVSVWTDAYKDPWDLDGKEYLVVYDKNNNDHFAMGAEWYENPGNTGLKRYLVQKPNQNVPVYTVTGTSVLWRFDARDDGTYTLSSNVDGTRKYVRAPGGNGELVLADTADEATALRLLDAEGKYVMAYGMQPRKLIDYFDNTHAVFSTWQKEPAGNNKFTLGLPQEVSATYGYPKFAGPWPEGESDVGTTNDLPKLMAKRITSIPYVVATPSRRAYHSRDELYQWNYEFAGWKVKGQQSTYQPGDELSASLIASGVELEAVWQYQGRDEVSKTVAYDLNFAKAPSGIPDYSKLTVSDDAETVSGQELKVYEVSSLTQGWYKAKNAVGSTTGNVYEFTGWKAEDGELITSSFIDLTDQRYDTNHDDTVSLTAVWNNSYTLGKTPGKREAQFFVSTVAISADAFNDEVPISTDKRDFTDAIHFTLMEPANMETPKRTQHAGIGQEVFALVGYDDKTKVNIAGNDAQIRQLASVGLEKDGITYGAMTFPSDEEVLDYLKRQDKAKLTLDGVEVDPVDINADNFTIRWYVCKYQSDGIWHIDGKLTPNLSYLKVEKNFLGDEAALQNIPSNFEVNVRSTRRTSGGIVSNSNLTNVNLTLSDQRNNRHRYGLYSGTATNGSFGYIEKNGDTYVWLVPVLRGAMFDITERNYTAVVDNITYGIAAQYSVTKTQAGVESATRTPWFGTVNGYAATYPRTSVNINDTSNIQSINLYNTYVETGVFVIQKIDAGLDGKGVAPMPGVEFEVYDITDGFESKVPLTKKWNAKTGRYNLQMYDSQGTPITGNPKTGDDGCIYLRLAAPNPEETQKRTFKIVEKVPDGYEAAEEDPYVVVTVDKGGVFTLGATQAPAGEHGRIEAVQTRATKDEDAEPALSGVTIFNQPKPVTLAVGKTWDSVNRQESVTLELTGKTGGAAILRDTIVLDESNAVVADDKLPTDPSGEWTYTWPEQFPMMIGNEKVSYAVAETKIGAYAVGSAAFNNWAPGYSAFCYEGDSEVEFDSSFSYDKIAMEVLNVDRAKDFVKTTVFKTNGSGSKNLAGAEFELYRELSGMKSKIEFNGEIKYVISAGKIAFTAENRNKGYPLNLEYGKTYYLRETTTLSGYASREQGYIQLRVNVDGTVALAYDDGPNDDSWQPGEAVFSFRDDDPTTREATLRIKNISLGRDVAFKKADSFGEPLAGASFALYGDPAGSERVEGVEVATSDEQGVVRFEKVPDGVYYLKEDQTPDGFVANGNTYVVLVGEEALATAQSDTTTFAQIGAEELDAQCDQYAADAESVYGLADEARYAVFLIRDGKAAVVPDVATYGIMNIPAAKRKAILKKVDDSDSHAPLEGAEFEVLRWDRTAVSARCASGKSGVYFIDELPHGTYYLHETKVPAGYKKLDSNDNWYELTVNEDGVKEPKLLAQAP